MTDVLPLCVLYKRHVQRNIVIDGHAEAVGSVVSQAPYSGGQNDGSPIVVAMPTGGAHADRRSSESDVTASTSTASRMGATVPPPSTHGTISCCSPAAAATRSSVIAAPPDPAGSCSMDTGAGTPAWRDCCRDSALLMTPGKGAGGCSRANCTALQHCIHNLTSPPSEWMQYEFRLSLSFANAALASRP
eukprot:363607-Chlamydomonas_euryale.AAC.9